MTYEVQHLSPSQIENWLGCNRQWYWEYPMGFKPPPKPSAVVGTGCHLVIEDFIQGQNGEDLTNKRDAKDNYRGIVRPAMSTLLALIAPVKAGVGHVEREMKRTLRSGVPLKGRIDFLLLEGSEPLVVDHKTTSNLDYAKTEEELRNNIQMLAYAYEAACLTKGPVTGVRVAHNVMVTRGAPQARYTETSIPVQDVHRGWTRINDIADRILVTSKIPTPAEVPENRQGCTKYGGCAHLERCRALWSAQSATPATTTSTPVSAQPSEKPMPLPASLIAKMTGRPAPANGAAAQAAPVKPPVTTPPARPVVQGVLAPEAPPNPRLVQQQAKALAAAASAVKPAPDIRSTQVSAVAAAVRQALPAQPAVKFTNADKASAQAVVQQLTPEQQAVAEGVALLQSKGWTEDEINAMDDATFSLVVEHGIPKDDDIDIRYGDEETLDDGTKFRPITGVRPKPKPVVQAAPARRVVRTQPTTVGNPAQPPVTGPELAAAIEQGDTATVHRAADQAVAAQQAEPARRRGRPPGSKNKPKDGAEAQPAAPAADPVLDGAEQEGEQEGEQYSERDVPSHYIGGEATLGDPSTDVEADPAIVELQEQLADIGERLAVASTEIGGVLMLLQTGSFPDGLDLAKKVRAWAEATQTKLAAETAAVLRLNGLLDAAQERVVSLENQALSLPSAAPVATDDAFVLYVDCLPEKSGVPFRVLDEEIAPFMKLAAENYKDEKTGRASPLTHYSLIPHGKGPGTVAAYVLANVGEVVKPGILYVDSRSPCAAAVLEVLRPLADGIVSARGR